MQGADGTGGAARPPGELRVRAEPWGIEIAAPVGARLYEVIRGAGLPLGGACAGEGLCAACGLEILAGEVGPEGPLERRRKVDNGVRTELRLACMVRLRGDLTVRARYW
jgi:2Fe-2S ferredoxin